MQALRSTLPAATSPSAAAVACSPLQPGDVRSGLRLRHAPSRLCNWGYLPSGGVSRRVVVAGHGMVGARFVEEVRRRDPKGVRIRLTVLGAEPRPAYNRVLLSTVLAGGLSAPAVELH